MQLILVIDNSRRTIIATATDDKGHHVVAGEVQDNGYLASKDFSEDALQDLITPDLARAISTWLD